MAHQLVKFSGRPGVGATTYKSDLISRFHKVDLSTLTGREITKILSYPLNVGTDPQQGHWIMFEIMKITRPTIAEARKRAENILDGVDAAAAEQNTKNPEQVIVDAKKIRGGHLAGTPFGAATAAVRKTFSGQIGVNSLTAKMATTGLQTVIALYMPPSVQVSYGAKYADQEIGVLAESVNAGIRAFMETGGGGLNRTAVAAGTAAGGLASGGLNWLKSKMPAGGQAIAAIQSGSIITPRMELMFEGIQRRNFSFNFMFIPKSEKEAQVVEDIVNLFKIHMSSNYGSLGMGGVDGVRELEIPDFFNIKYMYQSGENSHLNKIKQCVLQTATVEYGADRYKAYAGGRPQTTKLSLSFSEQEIITKDYIRDGF